MKGKDRIARTNQEVWDAEANRGGGHCTPWLDLDAETIRKYAAGELTHRYDCLRNMYPRSVLNAVAGKNVLCLASGGGQQSAVFSLLGAQVTVADLSQRQLDQDLVAARHYDYDVTLVQADMRDLSCLAGETFDLVYQAPSLAYVPSAREVYREVDRVLKRGGAYRLEVTNPAVEFVDEHWREGGYRITKPYTVRVASRADGAIEHRHYLKDIFNGLIELDYRIEQVEEAPMHLADASSAQPGSWEHLVAHIPWIFAIVARKAE